MKKWMQSQEWAIRFYMILMLVSGIIMSVMVPSWQTPDEAGHLGMIGEAIENPKMADLFQQDMNLDCGRISFQPEEKMNVEQWKAAMGTKPGYSWQECMPKGIHLSAIKHLPALIGIVLGTLLRLPTFWVMELGELFSLAFYLVICWQAIRLMPIKKELLLMVMAFPMSLQQAASISYDAVLLPLCFLFVAYIFNMRCIKEQLGWKEVIFTVLLLSMITYIKLPYALLGLLFFLLPVDKIHLRLGKCEMNGELIHRFRIPIGLMVVIVCAALLLAVRNNFWVQLVGGMLFEWRRTAYLFKSTAHYFWRYLIVSSVGQFGWLDSQLPFWFTISSYVWMVVFAVWGKEEQISYKLKGRTKIYIWIVFGLLSCLTVLSMVNHTIRITLFGSEQSAETYNVREAIYQIPYIGGLQGRYFLPFLVLPFLGLPQMGREVRGKVWLVHVYLVTAMLMTVYVLYFRYWA